MFNFISGHLSAADSSVNYSDFTFRNLFGSDLEDDILSTTLSTLGTAHADRKVIVAVACGDDFIANGMTIGGVTATKITSANITLGTISEVSFWIAAVPLGTSASMDINFSGNVEPVIYAYWTVNMSSSTPHDSATNTATSGTSIILSGLEIPVNGFAVFMYAYICDGSGSGSSDNVGLTDRAAAFVGGQTLAAEAFDATSVAGFSSPITFTATNPGSGADHLVVGVSFRGDGT